MQGYIALPDNYTETLIGSDGKVGITIDSADVRIGIPDPKLFECE